LAIAADSRKYSGDIAVDQFLDSCVDRLDGKQKQYQDRKGQIFTEACSSDGKQHKPHKKPEQLVPERRLSTQPKEAL